MNIKNHNEDKIEKVENGKIRQSLIYTPDNFRIMRHFSIKKLFDNSNSFIKLFIIKLFF